MKHQSSVDLRRIQITGGSSFMITLPKDWADSVGLKKNDTVGLQPQPDGSMVIYPGGEQAAIAGSTKVIDADGIADRDYLYRQLVGAYIAGHDVIELRSEGELSSMAASTASSFTQTAIGLEILEESDNRIVIKDLMDQGEIKPAKSVERMKVLVRNMLNDVLEALEQRDPKLLDGMSDLLDRKIKIPLFNDADRRRKEFGPVANRKAGAGVSIINCHDLHVCFLLYQGCTVPIISRTDPMPFSSSQAFIPSMMCSGA